MVVTSAQAGAMPNEGVVNVWVPVAMVATSAEVLIPLSGHLDWGQIPAGEISVKLPNGLALPAWLKFVPQDKLLVAKAIPVNALPLQVLVAVGAKRYLVDIREGDLK